MYTSNDIFNYNRTIIKNNKTSIVSCLLLAASGLWGPVFYLLCCCGCLYKQLLSTSRNINKSVRPDLPDNSVLERHPLRLRLVTATPKTAHLYSSTFNALFTFRRF